MCGDGGGGGGGDDTAGLCDAAFQLTGTAFGAAIGGAVSTPVGAVVGSVLGGLYGTMLGNHFATTTLAESGRSALTAVPGSFRQAASSS